MIALVITIVVIFIIATIGISYGRDLVDKSKVENLVTNMLTLKSKARVIEEEIESKTWNLSSTVEENETISQKEKGRRDCFTGDNYKFILLTESNYLEYGLKNIENGSVYYAVSKDALNKMGLQSLWKNESYYIIKYTIQDDKYEDIDIYYTKGIKYNKNTYYNLNEIKDLIK